MNAPEQIAKATLEEIERTGEHADRVLKRALRSHGELDNNGRRRVSELVHGIRCHRLRLGYLMSALRSQRMNRFELFDADRLGTLPAVSWPTEPVERLSVTYSVPYFVADSLIRQFGERAEDIVRHLNTPGPIAIRANTLLETTDQLAERLRAEGMVVEQGNLAPHALRLFGRPDIRGSTAWREGRFEVQDEASQMVAVAVGAQPNERILDLCAGAGGKTLALAAAMNDEGTLYAADVDTARLADLHARLTRVKVRTVVPVNLENDAPPQDVDRVLIDAPCSAMGTWRRGPDRKWHLSSSAVEKLAETQVDILERGASLVKPGGRVVYATCTLIAQENRDVVRAVRTRLGLVPTPVFEGADTEVDILPHEHDTDGFFIAAMTRPASATTS